MTPIPLSFRHFGSTAETLVTLLLPRTTPSSHVRFDIHLVDAGVDVPIVVYRPNNYTAVYVQSPLLRDEYRRTDAADRVPGWREIANHDSCWHDWYNAFDFKQANLRSLVEVKRVRVWQAAETPETLWRRQDWVKAEEGAPTFEWTGSCVDYPAWVALHLDLTLRYWAVRGKPLGVMEYEFRRAYPSNATRFLRWNTDDGVPTLTGWKTDFRGPYKPARSTGSFAGDIEAFITKPWKGGEFSRGIFAPSVEHRPSEGTWGI